MDEAHKATAIMKNGLFKAVAASVAAGRPEGLPYF
jgi:hypothetical protein